MIEGVELAGVIIKIRYSLLRTFIKLKVFYYLFDDEFFVLDV